ncbi:hypothetical protein [Alteribacillus sp. HJP-4]
MTVSQKKKIASMEREIEILNAELKQLKNRREITFEEKETDFFISEVYN